MSSIKLPKNSIPYVLFQRTAYLTNNSFFKFLTFLGSYGFLNKLSINLKSLIFSKKIEAEFNEDMEKDFSMIEKFLPQNASSILDIGCGVAGIDILISQKYNHNLEIYLIDKTKTDNKVYYSFKEKGSFYNSMSLTQKILEINGIDQKNIFTQEANEENKINFEKQFDIIISLISWGFHYPVSTYLDEAYKKLNKGGVLIMDVRKDTGGKEEIEKKFGIENCEIIFNHLKFFRIAAKNK